MKTSILLLLFYSTTVILAGQDTDSLKYESLDPYYFHLNYLKEDKAMIIDVREPFEFRGKRIKGAVNIPSSGSLEFAADTISKDNALFFYCTTDYRSKRVAEYFGEQGFKKAYSLDGGIVAWRKEGYAVERRIRKR